jgi:ATP-binding cassette subfamily B multidrug efflux pump
VILVSQRATSVRHCDQIVVMDDGHVAGVGTHEELRKTCPVYREICDSQYREEA